MDVLASCGDCCKLHHARMCSVDHQTHISGSEDRRLCTVQRSQVHDISINDILRFGLVFVPPISHEDVTPSSSFDNCDTVKTMPQLIAEQ